MPSKGAYVPPHRRGTAKANPPLPPPQTTSNHASQFVHADRPSPRHFVSTDGSTERASILSNLRESLLRFTRICCINLSRREDQWKQASYRLRAMLGDKLFQQRVERFPAVDGLEIMEQYNNNAYDGDDMPILEWDATKNAMYDKHIQPPMNKVMSAGEVGCAMSHVRLWKQVANFSDDESTMLILEDDCFFYQASKRKTDEPSWPRLRARTREDRSRVFDTLGEKSHLFLIALSSAWKVVPDDWDILYLGLSDRGERKYVQNNNNNNTDSDDGGGIPVHVFKPEYGFKTHAYALNKHSASVLLSHLPVVGPLDVWLADNEWFGLNVYCTVVANEGWQGEGKSLISQQRGISGSSDIDQSGRKK
eukprot:scaffold3791_cov137-Cylindrotheca_fusiformis.AAC.19